MANDIIEILCAEGVEKVVGVAHDWGSFLLSRLANYHPEYFSAYAFIDHGYAAPGRSLNVEAIQHINNAVQSKLGFSILGYFLFFKDVDAPKLLNENSASVESLFFTTDDNIRKKYQGAPGGLRTWLTKAPTVDLPEYLTPEDHEHFQRTFSVENGGYGPASNWYKAGLYNINEEDESGIPATHLKLMHPTLLIASTNYFITVTINFAEQMRLLVPNLRVETVTGGHWLQLERVDEVNTILNNFLLARGSS
ncbi:hypothetical protein LTR84_005846 [Exophiala bonariae]|uniref:AB hydrolase-1 domain-containing protein n=1 Tax=Exophiala bonariae TaxID=1690606 RepID=A0AAV9N653_9EURO|nr:hypothetical protein LTR84_005846 [Exophiala bonariae]